MSPTALVLRSPYRAPLEINTTTVGTSCYIWDITWSTYPTTTTYADLINCGLCFKRFPMSNRLKAATKHEMFSAGENFSTTSEDDQQGLINDLSRIKQEDSSPQSGFAYEELNSTPTASSTQTCPTCGGTGKLTRGELRCSISLPLYFFNIAAIQYRKWPWLLFGTLRNIRWR